MGRAIFLDRDGVINHNRHDYVKSWAEFEFLTGVFAPLQTLATTDYKVIIISNQSPIGRGMIKQSVIEDINTRMQVEIERHGGRVDGIYYCPHAPHELCDCRKPKPGLLLRASKDLDIDLTHSFFIGDAISDVEAALVAGCKPIFVLTGLGSEQFPILQASGCDGQVPVVNSLVDAVELIVRCQ